MLLEPIVVRGIDDEEIEEFVLKLIMETGLCFSADEIRTRLVRMGYDVSLDRVRRVLKNLVFQGKLQRYRVWRKGRGARFVKYCPVV